MMDKSGPVEGVTSATSEKCEDTPPPYSAQSSTDQLMLTEMCADGEEKLQEPLKQRGDDDEMVKSKYSRGNQLIKIAESVTRKVLIVQLALYLGLVVAALSSLHTEFDKKLNDDNNGCKIIIPVVVGLILSLLLICLSLVCEIPVAAAEYKTSSKIMNHRQFRILVFCGITVGMGVIMVIWDFCHLMIGRMKLLPQTVPIIPYNKVQETD